MKEIDKLIIATNIVNKWRYENQREHDNEESNDYTEAARAVGAMHALSSLFDLRGEYAPPIYGGKAAFRNWLTNIGEPDNTIIKMINEVFPDDPSTGS